LSVNWNQCEVEDGLRQKVSEYEVKEEDEITSDKWKATWKR